MSSPIRYVFCSCDNGISVITGVASVACFASSNPIAGVALGAFAVLSGAYYSLQAQVPPEARLSIASVGYVQAPNQRCEYYFPAYPRNFADG